jgi:hypothetical protein
MLAPIILTPSETLVGRVTSEEVLEVIKETIPNTVTDVSAFILVATNMIDKIIVEEYPDEFTDAYLKEMERWLAAHFVAIRYQTRAEETLDKGKDVYQYKIALGLQNTMWGQQVLVMDTTGSFAKLNEQKGKRPQIAWLGTLDDNGYST